MTTTYDACGAADANRVAHYRKKHNIPEIVGNRFHFDEVPCAKEGSYKTWAYRACLAQHPAASQQGALDVRIYTVEQGSQFSAIRLGVIMGLATAAAICIGGIGGLALAVGGGMIKIMMDYHIATVDTTRAHMFEELRRWRPMVEASRGFEKSLAFACE